MIAIFVIRLHVFNILLFCHKEDKQSTNLNHCYCNTYICTYDYFLLLQQNLAHVARADCQADDWFCKYYDTTEGLRFYYQKISEKPVVSTHKIF